MIGDKAHVYKIERAGLSSIGNIYPISIKNHEDGTIDLDEVRYNCLPQDPHLPVPRVIALESSHNLCNGRVLRMDYIREVKKICDENNFKLHLDGARCLNACTFLKIDPSELAKDFNTISLCFSKGLSCPFGTAVIGSHEEIERAKVIRKMLGGAMRQGGIMASACRISLEDWKEHLQRDHDNAQYLARELAKNNELVIDLEGIETNIIRFTFQEDFKKFEKYSDFS